MASVAKVEWTYQGRTKTAWVVRYKDAGGVRRQKKCLSKKGADALRLKIETEIERGEHVAERETITVAVLCDRYMHLAQEKVDDGRIGVSRQKQIEQFIRKSIKPLIGAMKLTELTAQSIEKFYSSMRREQKLQPKTAIARLRTLQLMQEFAIKRKWMVTRPVTDALKELRGIPTQSVRTFNVEEVLRLLHATSRRPRYGKLAPFSLTACVVNIAAFCGLRFGEIAGLTLDNVDLDDRVIHVRHSYCKFVGLKSPKTKAGVRDVPIPPHVVVLIKDWMRDHYRPNDQNLVFTTGLTARPLKSANFHNCLWGPLLKRAGLGGKPKFHFHALRHFAASYMIENGLPLTDVAALMGHAKFDMTLQVYAHPVVAVRRRHEAMDQMAERLLSTPLMIEGNSLAPATTA